MPGRTLVVAYTGTTTSLDRATATARKQVGSVATAAETANKKASGSFNKLGGGLVKALGPVAVALGVVGAAGKAFDFLKGATADAREAAVANNKLDQVLRSMGKYSPAVSKALDDQASSLSKLVGVDDEVIKGSQTILATFGNVATSAGKVGGAFERATVLTQDLAKAGFGSAEGNAKMLGKALNDPLKGISALSRAGVTFSAAQKKQIEGFVKSGDAAKAQNLILAEVEKQVGGVAGATATTADKMAVAWGEVSEKVGTALLPVLDNIGTFVTEKVIPPVSNLIEYLTTNENLGRAFEAVTTTLESIGGLVGTVFGEFGKAGDTAKAKFESFADFIATHQADMVRGFITAASAALGVGSAIAQGAVVGLRAYADLLDAQTTMVEGVVNGFGTILSAATIAFGWIPGVGTKLTEANNTFQTFGQSAIDNMKLVSGGARTAADGIEKTIIPAIDSTRAKLEKTGKTEIIKAEQRDAANKAAIAIEGIGTKANGAQIKVKGFAGITKLSSAEQASLRTRLDNAKKALGDQLGAMSRAKAGQGELTAAWKLGKQRLYEEFRQMGLSKAEAQRLADKYAGIPPKVQTKVTAPGAVSSKNQVEDLSGAIRDVPNKSATVTTTLAYKSRGGSVKIGNKKFNFGAVYGMARGGPIQNLSGRGRRGQDTELIMGAVGEHVWTDEEVRSVGGHAAMLRMRRQARQGKLKGYARGGPVERSVKVNTKIKKRNPIDVSNVTTVASKAAATAARSYGEGIGRAIATEVDRIARAEAAKLAASAVGGIGGTINVNNPRGLTTYRGGRFSNLFAAGLRAVERLTKHTWSVTQGGWNNGRVAASSGTHDGDAIDSAVDMVLLRGFRRLVGAMWHRTPSQGPWGHHMHGVPAPNRGYGSPGARQQWRNYKSGGDGLADRGGWIPTGTSLITNRTGRLERAMPYKQEDALLKVLRQLAEQPPDGRAPIVVEVVADSRGIENLVKATLARELRRPPGTTRVAAA